MEPEDIARLPCRRFAARLRGLSGDAVFWKRVEDTPRRVSGAAEADAITAQLRA